MSERRQFIPDGAELTGAEINDIGQIDSISFHKKQGKKVGKMGVLAAGIGLMASEGQAFAQRITSSDIGHTISQIYRTKKEAEARKQKTKAEAEAHEREVKARTEIEQAKIDAQKQKAVMEGAILGGGEMEVEVSEDGKKAKATTNPEYVKLQKEVLSQKSDLVKIYRALQITGGDFQKMWQNIDKAGNVSKDDKIEIEENWDEIVKILKTNGAIK